EVHDALPWYSRRPKETALYAHRIRHFYELRHQGAVRQRRSHFQRRRTVWPDRSERSRQEYLHEDPIEGDRADWWAGHGARTPGRAQARSLDLQRREDHERRIDGQHQVVGGPARQGEVARKRR